MLGMFHIAQADNQARLTFVSTAEPINDIGHSST
jgi:hypothetical protein